MGSMKVIVTAFINVLSIDFFDEHKALETYFGTGGIVFQKSLITLTSLISSQ
jgi:hypothetical protein